MSAEKETSVAVGFTRGPWKSDGCLVIAPGFILATVNWHSGYEHGLANARLIAAAPDLYEAVRVALGWATGGMDGDWRECDHIEVMRAALAKATPPSQEHATPSPTLAEQSTTRLSASTPTPTPTETNSNE